MGRKNLYRMQRKPLYRMQIKPLYMTMYWGCPEHGTIAQCTVNHVFNIKNIDNYIPAYSLCKRSKCNKNTILFLGYIIFSGNLVVEDTVKDEYILNGEIVYKHYLFQSKNIMSKNICLRKKPFEDITRTLLEESPIPTVHLQPLLLTMEKHNFPLLKIIPKKE